MSNIRIVSDGTAGGTTIEDSEGRPLLGVSKIEYVLDANGLIDNGVARLTFCDVYLDVVAKVEE